MARTHDQAIVLRTWEYSETSQTVALFTRGHGALRGLAKGARRDRGSFSGGFEPLTLGEIGAVIKPTTELSTLTDWDLQEVFRAARSDLAAHRAGLYIVDVLHHVMHSPDPHPELFDVTVEALRALSDHGAICGGVLRFLWQLLHDAGYEPRLDGADLDSRTAIFSPRAGGVVENEGQVAPGAPAWKVRPQTLSLLRAVRDRRGTEQAGAVSDQQADVDRASRLLNAHLCTVLDLELATSELYFGPGGESARR